MEDTPFSTAGQILSLHERGFTPKQIQLELQSRPSFGRISVERVRATIRQAQSRSADSQRMFAIYEMCLEMLTILRELRDRQPRSPRKIEAELPRRMGAALEKPTAHE